MNTKKTATRHCPFTNSFCLGEGCALSVGKTCAFALIADRLFHISIDTNDIAESFENIVDVSAIADELVDEAVDELFEEEE